MKRIIINMVSAIMLMALAASCSNSELDNMTVDKEMPLEMKAVVSQGVSRADNAQSMMLGNITGTIGFKLTIGELGEKDMILSSGGTIGYAQDVEEYVVNPAISYRMKADNVQNVPVGFQRDGQNFTFESDLSLDRLVRPGTTQVGTEIKATAILPFDVKSSGIYVKFNYGKGIPDGTTVRTFADAFEEELNISTEGAVRKSSDGQSLIYFVKLEKDLNQGDTLLEIVIPGDNRYDVTLSSSVDRALNKLFVTEITLSSVSRSSGCPALVADVDPVCW